MDEEQKKNEATDGAIKMGQKAAGALRKGAKKSATKGAVKAASKLNAASAVLTIATDERAQKVVLGAICIVLALILLFLYALPMMIFEYLQDVWEIILQERYEGSNGILAWPKAVAKGAKYMGDDLGDVLSTFFSTKLSQIKNRSSDDEDSESLDEQDEKQASSSGSEFLVTTDEEAEKDTLNKKIGATQSKVKAFCEDREEELTAEYTAEIQANAAADYESKYATGENEYGGCEVKAVYPNVSKITAVEYMSICSAVSGLDIRDMKVSDYMKWLGYKTGLGTWTGYCIPEYMEDIRRQTKYDDLATAALADAINRGLYNSEIDTIDSNANPKDAITLYSGAVEDIGFTAPMYNADPRKISGVPALELMIYASSAGGLSVQKSDTMYYVYVRYPDGSRETTAKGMNSAEAHSMAAASNRKVVRTYTKKTITVTQRDGTKATGTVLLPNPTEVYLVGTYYIYSYTGTVNLKIREADDVAEYLGMLGDEDLFNEDPTLNSNAALTASTGWLWPSYTDYITSSYGYRVNPVSGIYKLHSGCDVGAGENSEIWAAANGNVILAEWYGGYGNCVMIEHPNGYTTLYGHMNSIAVSKGDQVLQGDVIGYVGSTGNSTGPHLHFEIRLEDGSTTDPCEGYTYTKRTG